MKMIEPFRLSLAAVRTNANMTQVQWAEALGVDKGTVWNWENGKSEPSYNQVLTMSRLSGIPVDCIFIPMQS